MHLYHESHNDVHTTLNYCDTSTQESPYRYVDQPPPGMLRTNVVDDPRPFVVHDLRGQESSVGLDRTGFEFLRHSSAIEDFSDQEAITKEYYNEVELLLKNHLGAKRVFIFDLTLRRNYSDFENDTSQNRAPVMYVHVDQTFEASISRVWRHLPEDADRLLKGRVRIINVWRPFSNPVAHYPLALCDYTSLAASDLLPIKHIYPDRESSTFRVKYNSAHRWLYLADQTPDEVTLIKIFDSEEGGGVARLTPHTAFWDGGRGEGKPMRQSIEVRALVFDQE